MAKRELFVFDKNQNRKDLFNDWVEEYNKGKIEREKEFSDSKLFDEALRYATKFLKYKKRKISRLRKQEEELDIL